MPDFNPIKNGWADIKIAAHEKCTRIVDLSRSAIPADQCYKLVDSIFGFFLVHTLSFFKLVYKDVNCVISFNIMAFCNVSNS